MSNFEKFFVCISIVIAGFMVFAAGQDAENTWYMSMVFNLLMAVVWGGVAAFWLVINSTRKEAQLAERELEHLQTAQRFVEQLAAQEAERVHHQELHDILMSVTADITGGLRPPKPSEVSKIEKAFRENSDHYVRLTQNGKLWEAEMSSEPFPEAPKTDRVRRPRKAADAGKKVTTKKGNK